MRFRWAEEIMAEIDSFDSHLLVPMQSIRELCRELTELP
jgi:hypothetical protein